MFNTYIESLSKKYAIVGEPIFLSEEKSNIYNKLKSYYKTAFENNERIIVVQDCNDIYDYEDQPGESIVFLQRTIQEIDISNYFVVVITGNQNIEQELNSVKKLFSTDSVCIQHVLTKSPYKKNIVKRDTFCVLPWMHLYVNPRGNMHACCSASQDMPMGNLQENTVNEIINNERFRNMRKKMMEGKQCRECEVCNQAIKNNQIPSQFNHNKKWQHLKNDLIKNTNSDGSIREFKPVYFDLRLNNQCNLKCRTCYGGFSSRIAKEESILFSNKENIPLDFSKNQRKILLDKLLPYIDNAQFIYFAGGEPLIMDEHYVILDHLIEKDKTDVEISYNTNLTNLNYKGVSITKIWNKFKNIQIGASIDGHGKKLEYTRHGASWETIENNLMCIKKESPHVKIIITPVISLLSVQSLIELQQMWYKNNIISLDNYYYFFVSGKDHFSLQMLPYKFKLKIKDIINNHLDWLVANKADKKIQDFWKSVSTFMFLKDNTYLLDVFKKVNKSRDNYRNENFNSVYPEFAGLLD
jgi:radical SAM protein with 4Fe4S-binding SPASM domain